MRGRGRAGGRRAAAGRTTGRTTDRAAGRTTDRPAHRAAQREVAGGHADVAAVPGTVDEWVLRVAGAEQSHVDLADPTHLAFEYMSWIGHVVDLAAPEGAPLRVVHVGAGAGTLARYVAATRPGSRQVLLDPDTALLDLVRETLGLRSGHGLRVRAADGRAGLAELPAAAFDLVVRDAFAPDATGAMAVPAHLATDGFAAAAARVLDPAGVLVANLTDRSPFPLMRGEAATLAERWPHLAAVAEPSTLRGRRGGNVVLVASARALPWAPLARRLGGGAVAARLLEGDGLRARVAGARPRRDGDPVPPPPAPPSWT